MPKIPRHLSRPSPAWPSPDRDRKVEPGLGCPVCGEATFEIGRAPLNVAGARVATSLSRCKPCDLIIRDVSPEVLRRRSEHAGYTWDANRLPLLVRRRKFFVFLLDLAADHTSVRSVLDVGASYGHLIAIAQRRGLEAAGIEVVAALQEGIRDELGVPCWSDLGEAEGMYDLVAFIDSFYYFDEPHQALAKTVRLLSEHGLLLFRVTNRNRWIALQRKLGLERGYRSLGDVAVSWSLTGLRRVFAYHGLEIREIRFYERGWRRPLPHRLAAGSLAALSTVTTRLWDFAVSPGLIVVAGRSSSRVKGA